MKLPPIPTSLFLLFSSRIVGVIALPPRNYGVGSNDAIPQEMDISLGYDVAMWIAQWYFCPNCVTRCDTPSAPLIGPPVIVGRVEKALVSIQHRSLLTTIHPSSLHLPNPSIVLSRTSNFKD